MNVSIEREQKQACLNSAECEKGGMKSNVSIEREQKQACLSSAECEKGGMKSNSLPELIVMLTWHDYTVENASEIFEECKDTQAKYWGMKEHPLSTDKMRQLFLRMKECGKTTFLETVAYSEAEGLEGARIAADCCCDILMGTHYFDSIRDFCNNHGMRYMPFVGDVTGRPSILKGSTDDIIAEAKDILARGVYGIDLLGYRHVDNPVALNNALVRALKSPVCIAGSIDSYARLDEVRAASPWAFTIGSAFFEKKFGESFPEQINNVCNYISKVI